MALARDTSVVSGAERLSRRIATIQSRLSLPPMMDEIGDLLMKRTQDRFSKEVDPDYIPWVPLAAATIRRKQQQGFGDKQKLVRTEAMRKAIQRIRGRADGGTFTNTGAGFRIGITDPEIAEYARVQNRGNGRVPARRFLGIGRLDIKAVDSLLRRKAAALERGL